MFFFFFNTVKSNSQPAELNTYVPKMAGGETREFEGVLGQLPVLPNGGTKCHWLHRKVKIGESGKTYPIFICIYIK